LKAAVVYGENDIRIIDVPRPSPGLGEVLIKVCGSGVCATDVKILGGGSVPRKLPTILGHEVAGTIAALGEGVSHLEIGQRVAVYPIAACGECFFCQQGRHSLCLDEHGLGHGDDGGFAEYVLISDRIVNLGGIINIGNMPFDLAAMIEPTSCCISAADQCGTQAGDAVVIIGCGPLGLLHTIVSKARGAHVCVVDVNEERLAIAQVVGADVALNPEEVEVVGEVHKLTGIGADVVIAAVGIPKVIESYFPLVRKAGVFNIFGGTPRGETVTLDPRWLHYGEIVLTGTFASSMDHFRRAHEFVREQAGLIYQVISTRCALDDILDAVERVKRGQGIKSVIMFD
jgi:threonine dehydrogenase-like Zn-dependent dehydrogenase